MFKIRMGIPEMQEFWDDLKKSFDNEYSRWTASEQIDETV